MSRKAFGSTDADYDSAVDAKLTDALEDGDELVLAHCAL